VRTTPLAAAPLLAALLACNDAGPPPATAAAPAPAPAPVPSASSATPAPDAAGSAADLDARRKQLRALVDDQWEYTMRRNPEWASMLGDKRYNDRWSDRSEQAIRDDLAHSQDVLTRLSAIDTTGFPEQEVLDKTLMLRQLREAVEAAARRYYAADADCQAWEPSGEDFLSPALTEAHCMLSVLPSDEFSAWLSVFLPRVDAREPATLFRPATVSDRSDGRIVHLDGLNLSRAWSWRCIAKALPDADPRRAVALAAADEHLAAGLPHVAGDYMGEHWLATYAVLALEASG